MEHLVSRLAQMDPEVQLREKITDVFIKGLWEVSCLSFFLSRRFDSSNAHASHSTLSQLVGPPSPRLFPHRRWISLPSSRWLSQQYVWANSGCCRKTLCSLCPSSPSKDAKPSRCRTCLQLSIEERQVCTSSFWYFKHALCKCSHYSSWVSFSTIIDR